MLDKPRQATPLFVSIHDVAPASLLHVERTLDLIRSLGIAQVDLLVIPGAPWKAAEIEALRGWLGTGCGLAGHGWSHQANEQKTTWHRLHSALLSRNAAEHLSRSRQQVREIIASCFHWFAERDLPQPSLYVPPAWSMGAVTKADLRELPFRFYESFSGIYDSHDNKFHRIPLLGYEADTLCRSVCLTAFNSLNKAGARIFRMPLRMSIHPYDIDYHMREALRRDLGKISGADSNFRCAVATDWIGSQSSQGGS